MTTKDSVKRILANDRVIFPIPNMIDQNTPMRESKYFAWLNESVAKQNNFYKTITPYLAPGGYDIEKHTLESSELKSLECIFDHYQTMYMPIRNPCRLKALLKPATDTDTDKSYYVQGMPFTDRNTRYKPTVILLEILKNLGLVYDIYPKNFYFVLTSSGYLFINYQTILGSRRLAKIISDSEAFNHE